MRMLITAGPTREPIDAVRFISNRSSGRMGLTLATAAAQAGHEVTLLLSPVTEPVALPESVRVIPFMSTEDLGRTLEEHFPHCDCLVMAAAVADYRPVRTKEGKLPRSQEGSNLILELEPTPDLVAQVTAKKQPGQVTVAFALEEPATLEQRAMGKLRRKGVDAIVANPLEAMESDAVNLIWLTAKGDRDQRQHLSKPDAARWLIEHIEALAARSSG